MNYTTREIAEITDSQLIGDGNICVKNIAFDSRTIYSSADTAFLALNTSKNSGEKYIYSAIEKGIKIIISRHQLHDTPDITWIIVRDAIQFLKQLAKYHLTRFNLQTIGITGSNGKTIVKEWLYQSLFGEFATVKSPKSFNSQIGLPLSLLEINEKHELGIFEVGISKPGEMKLQEEVFSPNIGILTHIGSAHASNFSSEEELIEDKILLFRNSTTIIFNGDNDLVFNRINVEFSSKRLISYGFKSRNDLHLNTDLKNKKSEISFKYFGEEIILPIYQRDEATLSNALCIIAVLKELGLNNEKIREKISSLRPVEMRLESVTGLRNNVLINDSFNLDLDSLKIAFQFIKEYKKKRQSLVLTDFVEGKDSESLYLRVAQLTNAQHFSKVFLVGEEIVQYESLFEAETFTFNSTSELIDSHQLDQIENELILLKGARKFEIEKVKNYLELQKHDTILEVNLNAVLHNINVHKSLLKPETKMMAMVKANSYGLGGYEMAEFLQHHHIDYLGVAFADEGADLRKKGITVPIMVMNPEQHSYDTIIDYDLEPEIYSFRVLELFYHQLRQKGIQKKYPIHIKLETGMHRLGFKEEDLDELIQKLNKMEVKVESVFSHLSSSDVPEEKEYTFEQIEIFCKSAELLSKGLNYNPLRHILNTSGIVNYPECQFDMVRIGIGMVGISANPKIKKQLKNAVSFKTVISQISAVKKGDSIGYSRKYRAENDTCIATIPVGYADGIPRLIGNELGKVGINKTLFPIVGNVCMDMMMINIGTHPAREGDEVIIFNSNPTLEEFSGYCGTIPYEVLTSISSRVKRIYIKD
ncbi:bifunctional UDP-N-acetylmuramoyl-tripeptide:D-alanyl-D-alanine ligase/alanine racemase [Chryseobacterium sp.]|uniref:bifunctional UDP-N-acetylmuramoyl-tripeptide:D-alanyl-D-alanine ligase/alanine racemase n=1 Tax=Chryseobacterium sp. TaxID=1871047 RepID=UPI0011C7C764|nr:bifunctional UDP-N-acetylmuramoyl-tripeptide:D-alanyl-D-alanine ligase/alanine racemase [Chryseobacterium sp.]TXF76021.1 bifunctional UDP-N-acetylmuramoyl-tripeptide:D-alanyl-D-alanine ligase/alanine racemase [Chryseobacterium sp.]